VEIVFNFNRSFLLGICLEVVCCDVVCFPVHSVNGKMFRFRVVPFSLVHVEYHSVYWVQLNLIHQLMHFYIQ